MRKKICILLFIALISISNILYAFNIETNSNNIQIENEGINCKLYTEEKVYRAIFTLEYDASAFELITADSIGSPKYFYKDVYINGNKYSQIYKVEYNESYNDNNIIDSQINQQKLHEPKSDFNFYFMPKKDIKNEKIQIKTEAISIDDVNYQTIGDIKTFYINYDNPLPDEEIATNEITYQANGENNTYYNLTDDTNSNNYNSSNLNINYYLLFGLVLLLVIIIIAIIVYFKHIRSNHNNR